MPADREVRSQRNQRPRLGDRYRKRSRSLRVKARRLFFILTFIFMFVAFHHFSGRQGLRWFAVMHVPSLTLSLYSCQPLRSHRNEASHAEVVDGMEPDVKHLMQELQWKEHLNRSNLLEDSGWMRALSQVVLPSRNLGWKFGAERF